MQPLALSRVLAFKSNVCIEHVDETVSFLVGEHERYALAGARMVAIASLIDGRRTVQDIMEAAARQVSEPETLYYLHQLVIKGYLVTATPDLPAAEVAFWQGQGLDARVAHDAHQRIPVAVHSLGADARAEPLIQEFMLEALQQAGICIDSASRIRVVVTDDYLRPDIADINRDALQSGALWCLVKPVGVTPLIGPIFQPGVGPCWRCLTFWIRRNRPVEQLIQRYRSENSTISSPIAGLEASIRTALGLTALALARALAERDTTHSLHGHLLALDFRSLETSRHAVVKRPQCLACGDHRLMAESGERPIELNPVAKAFCEDGGYRQQTPQSTYTRYEHLISSITGAVAEVVPMPKRHSDLRAVYTSSYLICPRNLLPRSDEFVRMCAGKGRTHAQARASALCEALERFSGVYQGDEACVRGTMTDIGSEAVSVERLLDFSDTQYEQRERLNADMPDRRQWVPIRFDRGAVIDWTPGWSLTHDTRRYLPLAYCYAQAPATSGVAYCGPCGNGVAAGNCVEEAILQALLELIERDAVAIWWYNQIARSNIDLASFDVPYFDALKADYERLGWTLWVLDLTHDLGIPVCAALAHQAADDRFAIGFGCHLEARLAVQRSLTELNQIFDASGSYRAPWNMDRLRAREFLFPALSASPQTAASLPRLGGADLRADIEICMQRLHKAGLEIITVNKTRPDIELSVVQVVVPGLRHFWPRFAPGRLYSVPCDLGWLEQPLAENALNPVPLFV